MQNLPKVPMLEPADSQEAKDFIKQAFELSERFDTPVFVRTTTRISHSKSVVELSEPEERPPKPTLAKHPDKYVMVPAHARKRHPLVEQRIKDLEAFAEEFPENRMEIQDTDSRHYSQRHLLSVCEGELSGIFVSKAGHGISPAEK